MWLEECGHGVEWVERSVRILERMCYSASSLHVTPLLRIAMVEGVAPATAALTQVLARRRPEWRYAGPPIAPELVAKFAGWLSDMDAAEPIGAAFSVAHKLVLAADRGLSDASSRPTAMS